MNIFLIGTLILVMAQLALMAKSQRAQQQILEKMNAREYDQLRSSRTIGSSIFNYKKVYIQEEDGQLVATQTSSVTPYIPAINEKVSFESGGYAEAKVSSVHEHNSEDCTQIVIFVRKMQPKELPIYLDSSRTTSKENTK